MLLETFTLGVYMGELGEPDHIVQYSKYWVIYRNSILMLG
jgi:hypothetical protein